MVTAAFVAPPLEGQPLSVVKNWSSWNSWSSLPLLRKLASTSGWDKSLPTTQHKRYLVSMTWRNILCPACHTKSATPFHVPIWQLQFELGLLMMSFAQNYTNYMGSLQCWSWNHNTAAAYFFWSAKSRPVKLRCLRNSLDKGRPKSGKMDPRKLAWVDTEASESEIGRRWKKQRMWGLKMCFLPTWAAGADATVKRPALIHIRRPWSQQGIYPGNLVHNVSHMLQKIKSNTLISNVNYDVEKQRLNVNFGTLQFSFGFFRGNSMVFF